MRVLNALLPGDYGEKGWPVVATSAVLCHSAALMIGEHELGGALGDINGWHHGVLTNRQWDCGCVSDFVTP